MKQIPRQEIVAMFGGIGAINPLIYRNMLMRLAKNYDLKLDETRIQVEEVLKTLPSNMS
jgi:hypothetical protein